MSSYWNDGCGITQVSSRMVATVMPYKLVKKACMHFNVYNYIYAPLEKGHYVAHSMSFDHFTWSIPNLVQGLHPISRWSLFIFRSNVQRSRLNYSFEPSVLSTLYILIPWLLAYRFCFYREEKPEFCSMGGILVYVSETFLIFCPLLCWTHFSSLKPL